MNKLSVRPQNKNFGERAGKPAALKKHLLFYSDYYQNPKQCSECQKIISYERRENRFCNRSCAATYNNRKRTTESRTQQALTIKNRNKEKYLRGEEVNPVWISQNIEFIADGPFTKVYCRLCPLSNELFYTTKHHQRNNPRIISDNYIKYRTACSFGFHTSQYPEVFDQTLYEKYGIYDSLKNPNGITRDHMYSVYNGFKNNIAPNIISHPANCCLMKFLPNLKKREKSSITIEQLLEGIKEWDRNMVEVVGLEPTTDAECHPAALPN